MIALPPGEPTASRNAPSSNTRVGDIDERGFFSGAGALAIGWPWASTARNEKSVSWLFRKKPAAMRCEPKGASTVVVMETTSPRPSTTTKWLVPYSGPVPSAPRRCAPGGLPGSDARHRTCVVDQRGPRAEIAPVQQAGDRHLHEPVVGDVHVAVRVGQPLRLDEAVPAERRLRPGAGQVEVLEDAEDRQHRDAARRRRPHAADQVGAVAAAHRLEPLGTVGLQVLQARASPAAARASQRQRSPRRPGLRRSPADLRSRCAAGSRRSRDCAAACRPAAPRRRP